MKWSELPRKLYFLAGASVFFILIFLVSVIFLNPSSVGNENFVGYFSLWALFWSLIFITILILAFLLARNVIKVFFEYQAHTPGSGIKTKLILTFGIFSLFPSMIMLFIAYGLINQNLTRWVSAPSEQLLESSRIIHRKIEGSRLIVLEDSGHFPFIEAPEPFFREVRDFLEETGNR